MTIRWSSILMLLAFCINACSVSPQGIGDHHTSVYDRVMKAGVIRCGYVLYPPYCMKDPNTGTMTGIFVDATEEAGRRLALKVKWAEEVGYGSIFEGLRADRYDIFAGGLWPNAERAKAGCFSIPINYSVLKAYGRADEKRFGNNLPAINAPDVKIAVIDGAMESFIAKDDFPKAQTISLPQLSPFVQNFLNITSHKADVTFAEPGIVNQFLKNNPGTLKDLAPDQPLRIFGNTFAFKTGEVAMQEMLNTTLEEMLNDGSVDKIIKKYSPAPGIFYQVALPYRKPM